MVHPLGTCSHVVQEQQSVFASQPQEMHISPEGGKWKRSKAKKIYREPSFLLQYFHSRLVYWPYLDLGEFFVVKLKTSSSFIWCIGAY